MEILIKILDDVGKLKEKINTLRPFTMEMLEQLRQFYRIGLTFSSNAIEGNSLTLSETKVVMEDGITIGGKPLKDHLEAVGHGNAFDLMWNMIPTSPTSAPPKNHPDFGEPDIKTLHAHLFQPLDPEKAGKYRQTPIIVTGSSYVFPGPDEVPDMMKAYVNGLPEMKNQYDPVIYAAKIHAGLVRIHPFSDGNGRIARLLMNMVLFAAGYPVTIIPPIRRVEYINALEKSHLTGDDSAFTHLIATCVKESQKELLRFFHVK